MQPDFIEQRVVRGPIPAQRRHTRSAFLLFGMATPVLSVEEGAAALLASLKSLQQPGLGASGEKGDPFAVPTLPLAPLTLGTLAAPVCLATPRAQGGERARERWSTTCSSLITQRQSKERVRQLLCIERDAISEIQSPHDAPPPAGSAAFKKPAT
jgi:hypothetical protein